jgi:hypothetical protein
VALDRDRNTNRVAPYRGKNLGQQPKFYNQDDTVEAIDFAVANETTNPRMIFVDPEHDLIAVVRWIDAAPWMGSSSGCSRRGT